MTQLAKTHQQQIASLAGKLDGISPLATLKRGYAIATKNSHVLYHAKDAQAGDQIQVRLMDGTVDCTVND